FYGYRVSDLIQQIYTPQGLDVFINQDHVRASGASLEVIYRLPSKIDLDASVEWQRATFDSGAVLPNSPHQIGKLRVSVPFWQDRLRFSGGVQTVGLRSTYAGVALPATVLPEAVLNTKPLAAGLQLIAGVKNLSNTFYRDPAGLTPMVD